MSFRNVGFCRKTFDICTGNRICSIPAITWWISGDVFNLFLFLVPYTLYFGYDKNKTFYKNVISCAGKFILVCIFTVISGAAILLPFEKYVTDHQRKWSWAGSKWVFTVDIFIYSISGNVKIYTGTGWSEYVKFLYGDHYIVTVTYDTGKNRKIRNYMVVWL